MLTLSSISVNAQNRVRHTSPQKISMNVQKSDSILDGYKQISINHTLRLHGITPTGEKINLSVIGVGQDILGDCLIGPKTILHYSYKIYRKDNSYLVYYSIAIGSRQLYQDILIKGAVICKSGKEVEIYKNGDQSLKLSISETPNT